MNIAVIGAGYVGLTTGAIMAEQGHQVVIIERIRAKVIQLNQARIPFFEPGLTDIVCSQMDNGRLNFVHSLREAVDLNPSIDVYLICVGTPPQSDGSPDLSAFRHVLRELADVIRPGQLVVTKSSVPPGTNQWIEDELRTFGIDPWNCPVISNPEFLREGSAIADTKEPSRIIYGLSSQTRETQLNQLLPSLRSMYAGIDAPMMITTWEGAEMIKYTSNAFLANKISFVNEIAQICDAYAVNVDDVATGIGLDPRIGKDFLKAGLGYGGSCLPKDLAALIHSASQKGLDVELLPAIGRINDGQIDAYLSRLASSLSPNGDHQPDQFRIALWGLSFKANTDDTRMSPALAMLDALLAKGYVIQVYDPVVRLETVGMEGLEGITQMESIEQAADQVDAIIVCTDWSTFDQDDVDWHTIARRMRGNLIVDTRNLYDPFILAAYGLQHLGIARPSHPMKTIFFYKH